MENYQLEKYVWDDSDFDIMGWHDSTIWAMAADPDAFEFALDIDYIFKWVNPPANEIYFKFWVSPVTLIFENILDVRVDITSQQGFIEIDEVRRTTLGSSPNGKFTQYEFRLCCQEGEIRLQATAYKMYVRQVPTLNDHQSLSRKTRGGVCFAKSRTDA